ncbi:hypothetical protein O6H91_09G120200 [Diphasiastrum complanatum]|uniref:Uncharacterized protein n=1 Tax=Diphasiastrum complanatum TaxID=34168 RepID=A0ACC2CTW1_DIPCM|nr:hypothetical protein O6H91_Y336200 [Diphasiastrum complanatum]KAJ7545449.1 hypothetical protein O6H91_09G120200 [Diphasiastrum complanatum]
MAPINSVVSLDTKSHVAAPRSSSHSAALSASNPQFSFRPLDSAHFGLGSSFKTNSLIRKSLSLHQRNSAKQRVDCRCPRASAYPLNWENISGSSLYAILGVEQSVDIPEIKRAYRKMASRYHPDVCPAVDVSECTEKFLHLQNAYKVLSDPELRAHYDRHMTNFFDTGIEFSRSGRLRSEVVKEHWMRASWKPQWEAQVGNLRWRHAASAQEGSHCSTWGARMRKQNRLINVAL